MQRGALDHGDEIGGGARPCGFGEFDRALDLQRGGDAVDRLEGAGLARAGEIAAEPGDAQVRDPLVEARRRRLGRDVGLRRIGLVAPEHRVVGERKVGDGAGERAEMVEARDERERARPRQPPVGRLEAEGAAERTRHADRPVGVGAQRDRHEAPRHRRARAARRAAGHVGDVVRVARRAVVGVLSGEVVGVFAHVERADENRAGRFEPRDKVASASAGGRSRLIFEPAQRRQALHVEQVLDGERRAGERAEALAAGARGVDLGGLLERPLGGDVGERAERRVARLDASERGFGDFDARSPRRP